MKRILLLSLTMAVLVFAGTNDAFAQKKKKKKKTKMSKTEMTSTITSLQQQVADLTSQNEKLQADLNTSNEDLSTAQSQLDEAQATINDLRKKVASSTASATGGEDGVVFKVQIGAYKLTDLTSYFTTPKAVTAEKEGNTSKYMMGYFATFEEAKKFEQALRKAGFKDAWLVPYNNGNRISDDAAEELLGYPIRDNK